MPYEPKDDEYLKTIPGSATYEKIKEWGLKKYNTKVSSLYVAQVKAKHGLIERENYNKSKKENPRVAQCPPEKMEAIEAALRFYKLI
ncbi:MAG: hypothetical protein J5959_19060 [Butyrivibrio sp.]|nr:hypothetical protein [Butyrivibrio sp.]MBO5633537.1 hypothetical protein [Aeriscardovia sp.]